ncbi:MAG: OsmC family protein, partial [Myxococcales bacterium]
PAPFPHHYEVSVQLEDPSHAEGILTAAEEQPLRVGPPPQFDGRTGHQSPEDMLLAAVASCHMTTLVALARRKAVPIKRYISKACGTLEKTKDGLRFTSIRLHVEASTDTGREGELTSLIEQAETHCIISNALRVKVELEIAAIRGE